MKPSPRELLSVGAVALAGVAIWGSGIGCPSTQASPLRRPEKPDVLFIAIDDLNTDVATYGFPKVSSPGLEALARRGVVFDRAYCQYPMCNPSRTCVMTGLRPETTGILKNPMRFRDHKPDCVTLSQHFSHNGYQTIAIGKIHHDAQNQTEEEFDVLVPDPKIPKQRQSKRWPLARPNVRAMKKARMDVLYPAAFHALRWGPSGEDDTYEADSRRVEVAVRILREKHDQPLFLAVGFTRPHLPWTAPKRFFDMHPPESVKMPEYPPDDLDDMPAAGKAGFISRDSIMTEEMKRDAIAAYRAASSYVDHCIEELLKGLKESGREENTVVVLWSDHGQLLNDHFMWGKSRLFEKSCRQPLIVAAPWMKESLGTRTSGLVELIDIYPTLADLCGLPAPNDVEGTSFLPLMEHPNRPWKKGAFSTVLFRDKVANQEFIGRSVRTDRWRYSEYVDDPHLAELYDYETDPKELTNLAEDPRYAETVKELRKLLYAGWHAALPE